MSTIIRAGRVITGERDLVDAWVQVDGGRIVAVGQGAAPAGEVEQVEGWLIPGFVDVHVHGGGGGSFSNADVEQVVGFHRTHGTTTMLGSLVSEPIDVIIQQIERLLPHVQSGAIAGIHLEGPFLAARRCGAHAPHVLVAPDAATIERVLAVGAGAIRMVTIAPELPGALDAIRVFAANGIVAALGHSDADSALAAEAVDAGATQVTHLFNGMRPLHHRETSIADAGLLDSRLLCELILDGHHLSDGITEIALRLLDDRWIAITDAMAAAGLPDGRFSLGELVVEARGGVVRLVEGGSLAGSTLTMDVAFRAIVERFHRTPLEAVQATATRPAAVLKRTDIGVIAPGARANLLLWNEHALARVMVDGGWVA
jgi:N-acetylglucosamine-6-phosphate deacetylase